MTRSSHSRGACSWLTPREWGPGRRGAKPGRGASQGVGVFSLEDEDQENNDQENDDQSASTPGVPVPVFVLGGKPAAQVFDELRHGKWPPFQAASTVPQPPRGPRNRQ